MTMILINWFKHKKNHSFHDYRQDAVYHAKNQQTFRSNKKRIILFIILGQDVHLASINEDFKISLQPCTKQ
ncbi:hypothetical protein V1477_016851 [Vespula maculifrons]|uniref:Uncharacterized protein n=1 Tax=Vespula maculifrons TaxID=7453 RepID=A0ABD2B4F4_VESMC